MKKIVYVSLLFFFTSIFYLFMWFFHLKNTYADVWANTYSAGVNGYCAINSSQYVECWGTVSPYNNPSLIPNKKFVKIVANVEVCWIDVDWFVSCWGPSLTPSIFNWIKFVDLYMKHIDSSNFFMCWIKEDNTSLCTWVRNLTGTFSFVSSFWLLSSRTSCWIGLDTKVYCNSWQSYINSNIPLSSWYKSIFLPSYDQAILLNNSGSVSWFWINFGWTVSSFSWKIISQLSYNHNTSFVWLGNNWVVYYTNSNFKSYPWVIFTSVSRGVNFVCALSNENKIYCWNDTTWTPTNFFPSDFKPYLEKNWKCEDYTSSIPTLTNEQKYNLQWQTFTSSWYIQNEVDWKKIHWFWFNKNSNWTGSFLNYFITNLDDFSDVRFYDSSDVEKTLTWDILQTFTNSWYLKLENYFFAKWTVNDPSIYLNTFNKFQKINVKSTDVYAYRLYHKVKWEWTLILKNCITNTPCDISQVSSPLWYNSYDEILIVPFSTSGYIKFTDYRVDDIEIFSYTMEYATYPVCFYDDGSIDVNWEDFTQEEWQEYKETEIKNSEEKETSFCSALGLLEYIKNPICWMTWLDEYFKKNVYNTQFFVYFKNFTQFFTIVLDSKDLTYEFKFIWANLQIETIVFQFKKNDLILTNYLEDKYNPTFDDWAWKIIQWIVFFFACLAVWFFILWFLFLIVFPHTFIFEKFIKILQKFFPLLLDSDGKTKGNIVTYLALTPVIIVFLWLFNTFVFWYISILYSLYSESIQFFWFFIDYFYSILIWVDNWVFISSFNQINNYITSTLLIILFFLIVRKWAKL